MDVREGEAAIEFQVIDGASMPAFAPNLLRA
jgi:hypothetical protein